MQELCNWSRAFTHIWTARNWALHAGFQLLISTQSLKLSCGTSAASGYYFLANLCKELHRSDNFWSFSQCHARNSSLWSLICSCGTNFNKRSALKLSCFACKNARILCNWSRAFTHIWTARNWALHAGFQLLIFTQSSKCASHKSHFWLLSAVNDSGITIGVFWDKAVVAPELEGVVFSSSVTVIYTYEKTTAPGNTNTTQ